MYEGELGPAQFFFLACFSTTSSTPVILTVTTQSYMCVDIETIYR